MEQAPGESPDEHFNVTLCDWPGDFHSLGSILLLQISSTCKIAGTQL